MSIRYSYLVLTCLAFAVAGCPTSAQVISLRPNATWTERAAAGDLQRVIHAATGNLVPIRAARRSDREVITVGFAPGVKIDLSRKRLGDQGFVLKTIKSGGRTVLVAAGATPVATSYACFTLAEHFGAGFYLGGDVMPKAPAALPLLDVVEKPALEVRGVLPWYNFFDSPTAWNAEDYRLFIDQLARSKNNFLGFHSYDHEPFCAYLNSKGELTGGAPLHSTAQPTWGTVPMKTSEFAFGTDRYFTREYFGADCSMGFKTNQEGIDRAKKLLAEALWYAKARGVRTCVGFEVSADPTLPGELDNLELRLKQLLRDYPMLDYVWIWEAEGLGANGANVHPTRSNFGAYYRRWEKHLASIEDPRRKSEAVRVGIYALAAHRVIEREAPRVRMVVSGWGGDNWLHFTDLYPVLDGILPRDVIFAALDNIFVTDTVSDAYGKLSKGREFWPIPWFECDGDQWYPQPNAKRFFNAARDSLKKGAKGLLAIHWRTRDVEESHAYISQFAWNTNLSYDDFYREYARKSLGTESAAKWLMALQQLGYRWIGGSGQIECGGIQWNPAPPENRRQFQRVVVENKLLSLPGERCDYLRNTIIWATYFDEAARLLSSSSELQTLLAKLKAERRPPTEEEKTLLRQNVELATHSLGLGMLAYTRRVSNRGELGVLATINAKAWADLRDLRGTIEKLAGPLAPPPPEPEKPLAVSSILRLTTAYAGHPFRISALVHAASPTATARVLYRRPGMPFQSTPLPFANKGRLEGTIPASAVKGDMIEYYIEATDGSHKATWPSGAPAHVERLTILPEPTHTQVPGSPRPRVPFPRPEPVEGPTARATTGPLLVQLEWPDFPARAFRLTRQTNGTADSTEIAQTLDAWYEDRNVQAGSSYAYAVFDADTNRRIAQSKTVTVPEPPIPPAPTVRAVPGPGRVKLRWTDGGIEAGGHAVYRADSPDGPFTKIAAPVLAEPGKVGYYQVRALSLSGKESPPSNTVSCAALPADGPPVVALSFDGTDKIDVPNRVIEDGMPAFRTGPTSFVAIPHSDAFNTADEITVEFWVKLMSPGAMPVFVSHGEWNNDGYFVQRLGGIRFFLGGVGTVDAGKLDIGRWTHIVGTYDGSEMVLYIDGARTGDRSGTGAIKPNSRTLYVGRYESPGTEYTPDAFMAGFRLYAYALSPTEVQAHFNTGKTGVK